uniref:Uncharacterized protein n=1 Tax=Panagrolaimus davidi TaxID=227884 RepID=A0A914PQ49_9BILA
MCRPIDQEHAEDLLYRLGDVGFGNFSTILNQSFFVVYEDREDIRGVTRYGVIDGNIRLAAATKYNETASFNKQIRTITVDYILKQKPSISQAIGISTLASNAAQHDRLEYDPEQILRNARLILKNDCKILKIVPNSDPSVSAQQWQRDHEKIVREELAKVLNVDPAKVFSSIWRTVQIPDDDFDAMIKSLTKYGTSIAKLTSICASYQRRPRETVRLCSIEYEDPDDFFAAFDDITGCDWQRTLKDKKAYDDTLTDDEHAHLILGELYDSYNAGERTNVLEKFLTWRGIAEASRRKTYPDPTSKLNFYAEKFPVFLNDAPTPRPSKNSRAAEPGDEIPPKKGKRSASSKKKPKTTIEFNTGVEMHTLREDYFNHLQDQPHVVGLLSFFLKSNSKNLGDFPDNNIVRRMANQYTSNSGTFDWDKYNTAVTAAAVQQRDT